MSTSEPLVLHVPDTNDRYYVLQFVDAWTDLVSLISAAGRPAPKKAYSCWPGQIGRVRYRISITIVRAPTNIFHIVRLFPRFLVKLTYPLSANCHAGNLGDTLEPIS